MSLKKEIRQQSRIDSRRFSKSVICRIITGELLDFLKSIDFIPTGMFFDTKTGLCTVHQKVIACPIIEYKNLNQIYKRYKNSINQIYSNVPLELKNEITDNNIDNLNTIKELQNLLKDTFNQKVVFVSIENLHDGKLAGLDPEKYDIAIDSLEIKNDNIGRYIIRNKTAVQRRGNI